MEHGESVMSLIVEWQRLMRRLPNITDFDEILGTRARLREINEILDYIGIPRFVEDAPDA